MLIASIALDTKERIEFEMVGFRLFIIEHSQL
jgi:hypothetical protein